MEVQESTLILSGSKSAEFGYHDIVTCVGFLDYQTCHFWHISWSFDCAFPTGLNPTKREREREREIDIKKCYKSLSKFTAKLSKW